MQYREYSYKFVVARTENIPDLNIYPMNYVTFISNQICKNKLRYIFLHDTKGIYRRILERVIELFCNFFATTFWKLLESN